MMPPNYRSADKPGRNCGTCKYYYAFGFICKRYNIRTRKHMVCRTWKPKLAKRADSLEGHSMIRPEYTKVLTAQERLAGIKLGVALAAAEHGLSADRLEKTGGIAISPEGVGKAIITVSLLTGIPAGIVAHVINKRITAERARERELKESAKYYRTAAKELERNLAAVNKGQA